MPYGCCILGISFDIAAFLTCACYANTASLADHYISRIIILGSHCRESMIRSSSARDLLLLACTS